MSNNITLLGNVRNVRGSKIIAEITHDFQSPNLIFEGCCYRIGQIGSFVKINLGFQTLYGIISMVGSSEIKPSIEEETILHYGNRWIEIQLVGEALGSGEFQRGVSTYPTIDDGVHIVTEKDLEKIYQEKQSESWIKIGSLSSSENLPAYADIDKLLTRHSAILGVTGSGKSNCVAKIVSTIKETFSNARIIIVDPHGEYSSAFKNSRVYSINDPENPLYVPFWALNYDELIWFLLSDRKPNPNLDSFLRENILDQKKEKSTKLKAGICDENKLTINSPIPFSLRKTWYDMDFQARATYMDTTHTEEALEKDGDFEELIPAVFKPHAPSSKAPYKSPKTYLLAPSEKILSRLKDPRFDFLLLPGDYDGKERDIDDLLKKWIGHKEGITILNMAGIPSEILDLVVGVVTRILFEGISWAGDIPAVGKKRPLLLILEEAHLYLPRSATGIVGYAKAVVTQVFKEGRKFGIGAMVISQRPSELDETVLSQCGTFLSFRITSNTDQATIKSMLPDTFFGLVDFISTLRTGEAIITGEAVNLPSRIRFQKADPPPKSIDPKVAEHWSEKWVSDAKYDLAVTNWRNQSKNDIRPKESETNE